MKITESHVCLAVEFSYMRKATTKVDVFSFGIVMLEFFHQEKADMRKVTIEVDGVPHTLRQLVEKAFENGINGVLSVVDHEMVLPTVTEKGKAVGVLKLALSCTQFNVEDRPDMKDVLSALLKLRDV